MTESAYTVGAEVICHSPGQSNGLPGSILTSPSWPNPAQRLPVSRSSAISLASLVTVRTRVAQGPAAAPESRQKATPRQVNRLAGR